MRLVRCSLFIWQQWKPHFLAEMLTDWVVIHANQGSTVHCLVSTVLSIQTFPQVPCEQCMFLTVVLLSGSTRALSSTSSFRSCCLASVVMKVMLLTHPKKKKKKSWLSCAQQTKQVCVCCVLKVHELSLNYTLDGLKRNKRPIWLIYCMLCQRTHKEIKTVVSLETILEFFIISVQTKVARSTSAYAEFKYKLSLVVVVIWLVPIGPACLPLLPTHRG